MRSKTNTTTSDNMATDGFDGHLKANLHHGHQSESAGAATAAPPAAGAETSKTRS
jgi:hypothetical protein